MGGFMGLDRKELINNTHYRVLFVKGLYKHVSIYFLYQFISYSLGYNICLTNFNYQN